MLFLLNVTLGQEYDFDTAFIYYDKLAEFLDLIF